MSFRDWSAIRSVLVQGLTQIFFVKTIQLSLAVLITSGPFVAYAGDLSQYLALTKKTRPELQEDLGALQLFLHSQNQSFVAPGNLFLDTIKGTQAFRYAFETIRSENLTLRNSLPRVGVANSIRAQMDNVEMLLSQHLRSSDSEQIIERAATDFGETTTLSRQILHAIKEDQSNWVNDLSAVSKTLEGLVLAKEAELKTYSSLYNGLLACQSRIKRDGEVAHKIASAMTNIQKSIETGPAGLKAIGNWPSEVKNKTSGIDNGSKQIVNILDQTLGTVTSSKTEFDEMAVYIDRFYLAAERIQLQ